MDTSRRRLADARLGLVVLEEPRDRLVERLFKRRELEAADEPEQLLVRRGLAELAVSLGCIELQDVQYCARNFQGISTYGIFALEANRLHNGISDSLDGGLLVLANCVASSERRL